MGSVKRMASSAFPVLSNSNLLAETSEGRHRELFPLLGHPPVAEKLSMCLLEPISFPSLSSCCFFLADHALPVLSIPFSTT